MVFFSSISAAISNPYTAALRCTAQTPAPPVYIHLMKVYLDKL